MKGRIEMIYVARHGQTDWNVQKKVMGRCDEPLNETGLQQAEETRNNLLNILYVLHYKEQNKLQR